MFDDNYVGVDLVFCIKFLICFVLLVILPVWIFNLVEIGFIWKIGFTIAGGFGVGIALMGNTIKYGKYN